MESEIDTVHLQSSHPRKQPKTHGCWSPSTTGPTTEPTTSPYNRPISANIALSHDRIEQAICGGDGGAAVTVHPSSVITVTPPLPEQPQVRLITRIVGFVNVGVAASFGKSSEPIPPDELHG